MDQYRNTSSEWSFSAESLSEFISVKHLPNTHIYPGQAPGMEGILQSVHIYACKDERDKLNKHADPSSYLSLCDRHLLGQIVGCGNRKFIVSTKNVIEYFKESSEYLKDATKNDDLLYIWTNLKTGKQYIGQAKERKGKNKLSLRDRTVEHFAEAVRDYKKSGCRELNHAIRIHRKGDWILQVLRVIEHALRNNISGLEHYYIEQLKTVWPDGYNMDKKTEFPDPKANDSPLLHIINQINERSVVFKEDLKNDYARNAFSCAVTRLCRFLTDCTPPCNHLEHLELPCLKTVQDEILKHCFQDNNCQAVCGWLHFTKEYFCMCGQHVIVSIKATFKFEYTSEKRFGRIYQKKYDRFNVLDRKFEFVKSASTPQRTLVCITLSPVEDDEETNKDLQQWTKLFENETSFVMA
ncbi:unnamed protein product [Rotaria socialis]|uniref:Uncharacterized protein n=1 Tax=Rotaria socialis TaxID=392032 RepID=A0A817RCG4_9BILA|nr:unnamed protein product [Rotaria socialis]CAF4629822.1 unnamed protein product [Rotaria socialis]